MRVKVKICGLTRGRNVRATVSCGADAVGFVFATGSKRKLTLIKHGNSYNWFRRSLAVWVCFLTRMRQFIEQAKSE